MERIAVNLSGKPQRRTHKGREYLVTSATLIVPGVLNGSQGPLYYPPDEVAKDPRAWNHIPVVVRHPQRDGIHVSGRDPEILEEHGIGHVYKATANGKLTAEAWFDVEATRNYDRKHGTAILPRLEKGEGVELSTGLFTDNLPSEGTHNGKAYTHIARNYRPDHLALLPDERGACSIADGCGFNVNAEDGFDSDEQRRAFFGLKAADEAAKAAGKDSVKKWNERGSKGRVSMTGAHELKRWEGAGDDIADSVHRRFASMPATNQALTDHTEADSLLSELSGLIGVNVAPQVRERIDGWLSRFAFAGSDPAISTPEESFSPQGDADMDRKSAITFLTANCDCWKDEDGQKTLNAMSDGQLTKLKANVEKTQTEREEAKKQAAVFNQFTKGVPIGAATLTVNADGKPVLRNAEGEECAPDDVKCLEMLKAKEKKEPTKNSQGATVNQQEIETGFAKSLGFESVNHLRATLNTAKEIEQKERTELVQRLVGNVADDAERQAAGKTLLAKPLEELRLLAKLLPTRAPQAQPAPTFNYVGAAGGPVGNLHQNHDAELLDLPVMNAEMWAGQKH